MLTVTERKVRNVVIVDLDGRVLINTASALRKKVEELLDRGERRILLNLRGVPHMDSSGLGELTRSHASTYNFGGQIKLLGLTERVERLVEISRLDTVFEIFTDEKDAVSSFR